MLPYFEKRETYEALLFPAISYIVLCAVIFQHDGGHAQNRSRRLRAHADHLPALSHRRSPARSLCPALDEEKGCGLHPRRRRLLCAHGLSVRGVLDGALPDGGDLHQGIRRRHHFLLQSHFRYHACLFFSCGRRSTATTLIALALELLAVLIIIDPLHASLDPTGALLAIASALVFSFYSVVGKKRTPRFGGIAVTCFSFLFGSVELLAVLLLGRTAAVGGLFASLGLDIFVNVPLFSGIPLSRCPRSPTSARSIRRRATSAT